MQLASVKPKLSLWFHGQQQRCSGSPIPPHPSDFFCFHLPSCSLPGSDLYSCVMNHTGQTSWQKTTNYFSILPSCISSVPLFVHDVATQTVLLAQCREWHMNNWWEEREVGGKKPELLKPVSSPNKSSWTHSSCEQSL